MSTKAVREYHGKKLIARHVQSISDGEHTMDDRSVLITPQTDLSVLSESEEWLLSTPQLVVKPDQLIKRRGKAGLVGIKLDWEGVQKWIGDRMETEIQVEQAKGTLDHFIVEPFVPHDQSDEYYICIQSTREGEEILFCAEGGVDVGDVDAKAARLFVSIDDDSLTKEGIEAQGLLKGVPTDRTSKLASFVHTLLLVYRKLNFVYMEINPIVFDSSGTIVPLDLAAKIDETAAFLNASEWGHLDFPAPFGRKVRKQLSYLIWLRQLILRCTLINILGIPRRGLHSQFGRQNRC